MCHILDLNSLNGYEPTYAVQSDILFELTNKIANKKCWIGWTFFCFLPDVCT